MLDVVSRTKISIVLLLVLAALSVYFWLAIPGKKADGVYHGIGQGFGGDMELAVTFADGNITEIEIVSHGETPFIADLAFKQIFAAIIESQSTEVDIVSGATGTSNGIISAVDQVLTGK